MYSLTALPYICEECGEESIYSVYSMLAFPPKCKQCGSRVWSPSQLYSGDSERESV